MTETELKPGPELDALVAEKVLGCKVRRVVFPDCTNHYCACPGYKHADPTDHEGTDLLENYSTEIRAAWNALEHLKTRDLWPSVSSHVDGGWICEIRDTKEYFREPRFHAIANTAPHAICLAALKACGVKNSTPNP